MNKLRLSDNQGICQDHYFDTKEEARQRLISFHEIDWTEEDDINKKTLDEMLDYGERTLTSVEGIACPLCDEFIEVRTIRRIESPENFQDVPKWSCPDCPFVGFEYVHQDDAEIIAEHLEQGLHI